MKYTIFAAAVLAALPAGSARADDYHYRWIAGRTQPHHSSTFQEGIRRGTADVIRAWGEYNYLTGRGRVYNEEARSMNIDNRMKALQAKYETRRMYEEYKAAHRKPRLTKEQIVRLNKLNDPDRLSVDELDPVTGEIHWPAALQGREFAACRAQMEAVFENRRPVDFGVRSQAYRDAAKLAKQMSGILWSLPDGELDTPSQVVAKNFIASLAEECKYAPVGADVAQNDVEQNEVR